jgi:tetraacyldisaccharide 4'-kinase
VIARYGIEPFLRRIVDAETPKLGVRLMRAVLACCAAVYGGLVGARNAGYNRGVFRIHRLPCRVVSVGNLTVGGTGKTPTVMALARSLSAAGARPCILIRGYGGAGRGVREVSDGGTVRAGWREVGDEAVLLAETLPGVPVIAGGDRVAAGRFAIERFHPDVILLDDGFQHRRIFREADLVLVDATDPFGGGWLLPRGRLREPVAGLRRAHAILVTRVDQVAYPEGVRDRIGAVVAGRPIGMAVYRACALRRLGEQDRGAVGEMRGKRVLALSGIANPRAFHRTLEGLGAVVMDRLVFPDHHPFGPEDRRRIEEAAGAARAEWIVTTEKDAVRLGFDWRPGYSVVAVEIVLDIVSGADRLSTALGVPLERADHD